MQRHRPTQIRGPGTEYTNLQEQQPAPIIPYRQQREPNCFFLLCIIPFILCAVMLFLFCVASYSTLLWNVKAEIGSATIKSHKVYIYVDDESSNIRGIVHINSPINFVSEMPDICDRTIHTEDQCRDYLKNHYPIGKMIDCYYHPDEPTNVAWDKRSMLDQNFAIPFISNCIVIVLGYLLFAARYLNCHM